jgi:mannose-6-phosphate isomerase-like protein (cupin superfamily)
MTMTIKRGESIGLEVHPDTDQMLIIQKGNGIALLGKTKSGKLHKSLIGAGQVLMVPAGTWHNIQNVGRSRLKIVSLYAPPHH